MIRVGALGNSWATSAMFFGVLSRGRSILSSHRDTSECGSRAVEFSANEVGHGLCICFRRMTLLVEVVQGAASILSALIEARVPPTILFGRNGQQRRYLQRKRWVIMNHRDSMSRCTKKTSSLMGNKPFVKRVIGQWYPTSNTSSVP